MEALASWSAALTFDAPIWFREFRLCDVSRMALLSHFPVLDTSCAVS